MDRDIRLSNVKGLLIFLVVLGHLLAPYQPLNIIYLYIFSFHMPLFILLTGYFAKHVNFKKVMNFVLILIIFHPLYRYYLVIINTDKVFNLRWEVPYYHLWYLLAVIFWYLIAITIRRFSANNWGRMIIVIISFAIGISARYFSGAIEVFMKNYEPKFISDTFSYLRTLTFLPFFMLGFCLTQENMQKLYRSLKGNRLIPIFVGAGLAAYLLLTNIKNEEKIFKGNYGVFELKGSLLFKTSHILIAYVIALLMIYVILNVMSSKVSLLTKWGDRTLPVYLFHAFFIMVIKKVAFFENLKPWFFLPIMLIFDFIIVWLLSSDFFIKYTKYLWNPYQLFEMVTQKNAKNR